MSGDDGHDSLFALSLPSARRAPALNCWVPVRSRREPLRTWASLTAVGRFAHSVGLRGFTVEL